MSVRDSRQRIPTLDHVSVALPTSTRRPPPSPSRVDVEGLASPNEVSLQIVPAPKIGDGYGMLAGDLT